MNSLQRTRERLPAEGSTSTIMLVSAAYICVPMPTVHQIEVCGTGETIAAVGPDSPMIGVYSLDIFTERVSKIIHSHADLIRKSGATRNDNEESESEPDQPEHGLTSAGPPLFLYIAWQNCHDPYDVPQKCVLRHRCDSV
eukprot:COSAG02_NODE_482_length_21409_cov_126.131018_23_plen_140_part_00